MTDLTEASLEQVLKDLTAIHHGGQAITQRQYLRQARERERIREHMKTALSMDCPTSRAFSADYYLDDPYLDVRLGTLDGWCFGRFIHDPLWHDVDTGLPAGDTLIVGWTDPSPFVARRIRCSPALMRALERVAWEDDS